MSTIDSTLTSISSIPLRDAQLLLAHVLKKEREYCIAHPKEQVTLWQYIQFRRLAYKRANNYPLAYLLGYQYFYGRKFLVNKYTLIPRPETEQMVELAVQALQKNTPNTRMLIDIGTGSGCIPISIAQTLKETKSSALPNTLLASDISKQALQMAQKNAAQYEENSITFLHGNLLDPILPELEKKESTIILTANLPYITQEQFQNETSIQHEPQSALIAADNGLALYKELLQQIISVTKHHQWNVFLEIDPDQKEQIQKYIIEQVPRAQINIHNDLAGKARIVEIII